MDKPLPFIITF